MGRKMELVTIVSSLAAVSMVRAGFLSSPDDQILQQLPCAHRVVMPSPSWPVARYRPGHGGQGPISGSLSGVAARKPSTCASLTRRLGAACTPLPGKSIRRNSGGSMVVVSTPYWRDEPINNWPVRRGWTLKATESLATLCALFR